MAKWGNMESKLKKIHENAKYIEAFKKLNE